MVDLVETIKSFGDQLGGVWAFFEDGETGDLTALASVLLALLALATAFRCYQAFKPAMERGHSNVVAIGGGMAAVFLGVGIFFLVQAVRSFG